MRTHRFKRGQAASGGQGADPVADDAMDVDVPRDVITMVTRDVAVHRARFVEIDYPDAVATTYGRRSPILARPLITFAIGFESIA